MDLEDYIEMQLAAEGHTKPADDAPLTLRGLWRMRVNLRRERYCLANFDRWIIDGELTEHPVSCFLQRGHEGPHGVGSFAMEWDGERYVLAAA